MSVSKARRLLAESRRAANDLRSHLLVAAALREALPHEPIVVGGTAEEFWTAQPYHETDLDVCVPFGPASAERLVELGFERDGRHWVFGQVAVEIPESHFDGDYSRTVLKRVGEGAARIIGVDDLYVDRLHQATMWEDPAGIEFHSAFAVARICYDKIDWPYVRKAIARDEPYLVEQMKRIDARIRGRVRRAITDQR